MENGVEGEERATWKKKVSVKRCLTHGRSEGIAAQKIA